MSWMMPAEWAPQERIWMAWPTAGYTLGDTPEEVEEARRTWAAVANAIIDFEPVTMVVDPRDEAIAPRYLSRQVEIRIAPLNDAWMRDMGPTFVVDDEQPGQLGAVDWIFNGWGGQDWAQWDKDARIGRQVGEWAGATGIDSPLVNEGGGIHVDGDGTVLLTETVQLDPGRNPDLGKADVEQELARTLGIDKAIWLPRGLTRDAMRFGTRGHVDITATFVQPGLVLVHDQQDDRHPDAAISRQLMSTLSHATDARDRALDIIPVPAPKTLQDADGPVDYSYINHLVVNGGVIACSFGDDNDAQAVDILSEAYPERKVITVNAKPLYARGGGIHCITQQQPATR